MSLYKEKLICKQEENNRYTLTFNLNLCLYRLLYTKTISVFKMDKKYP